MQLAQAYTIFARDGDMVPISLVLPEDGKPAGAPAAQQVDRSAQTARGAQDARDGHPARRHRR